MGPWELESSVLGPQLPSQRDIVSNTTKASNHAGGQNKQRRAGSNKREPRLPASSPAAVMPEPWAAGVGLRNKYLENLAASGVRERGAAGAQGTPSHHPDVPRRVQGPQPGD